ncbi:MOSC domain-containing protein, partial [Cellulosimicrobium funkei]|uniref:MOSC domain-containing protein n=1 Tax=Cellulosimicrobium funkei TaxID=264251 RepID=UPI003F8DB919
LRGATVPSHPAAPSRLGDPRSPAPAPRPASAVVLEVRTGGVGTVAHRGREVPTAFRKRPRLGPVAVGTEGLEGDAQADRRVHGGPEKAVCVYPVEHYAAWRDELGADLPPGAFGENLLTRGLTEDDLLLGDVLALGTATLQVSMPRRPCYKLAAVHGLVDLPDRVQASGRTGWYLRVLTPGTVRAGATAVVVGRPARSATVREVNRVMNLDRDDLPAAAALAALPTLPARWRDTLARRLRGGTEDDRARLWGPVSESP